MESPLHHESANLGRPRGFGGLRVVSLESRMSHDAARLVREAGGVAIPAPSLEEAPLEVNAEALAFADALIGGSFDVVIFLTGVGARYLMRAMETRHARQELVAALTSTTVVARGPKPVQALRELGVAVDVAVPEPNTWREILATLDAHPAGLDIAGKRVAVQEYGIPNDTLLAELTSRGARVTRVPIYQWRLPTDLWPLRDAIAQVIGRTVDVMLFTSATQVYHLFEVVRAEGCEAAFRQALGEVVIASVGPICSEALAAHDVDVDIEASRGKLGILIREAAERSLEIVMQRRAERRPRRLVAAEPTGADLAPHLDRLADSPFLRACRGQRVPHTPVWLMRQAGRYMQEYREVRAQLSFIELCKRPEVAAEVAVTAQQRLGVDAAILFSDILLIVEPMGMGLAYTRGEGPSITHVVREAHDVDRLLEVDPHESLAYVFEAVRRTRAELPCDIPLIGFSGAPFTLASYICEGGGSKNYIHTKRLMYTDEGAWNEMMARIARSVGRYLLGQIEAGAQAVQLFDSWVGCLSPEDYERYVLPHTRAVFEMLPEGVPSIHFGTDTATLLELQATCGSTVLGVDHKVPIASAFDRFEGLAIQGNLDPVTLFAGPEVLRRETARILDAVGGRNGHIFNLGHGIMVGTPVDDVIALVDAVHELSAR